MATSLESPEIIIKQINEQVLTFTYVINKIGIRSRFINLEKNAIFDVIFYGADDLILKTELLILTTEEYNMWGTDDSYIINLVSQKYNVTFQ
jgi:hypothetical protein